MITNNLNINDRNSSTNYNKPFISMVYILAVAIILAIALLIIPFKPVVAVVIIGSTLVISVAMHLFLHEEPYPLQ